MRVVRQAARTKTKTGDKLAACAPPWQPVDALGLRFYWAAYGVLSLALLAAACRSRRQDEP